MENRIFGKEPQKSRPKKKRGKNLTKTTETEDHFVDSKTLVAFDKTLIGKSLYIWGLTCQDAGMTKNTLLRYNAMPADQYAKARPIRAGCRETSIRIPQRNLCFFEPTFFFAFRTKTAELCVAKRDRDVF